MKKLLAVAIVFSFSTADAGFFSTAREEFLSSIRSTVGNAGGSIETMLDQSAVDTLSANTKGDTIVADPTVQAGLVTALNSLYEEAKALRRKNLLRPKILYYASNLCTTLQGCVKKPAEASKSVPIIESYIKNLQTAGIDVTNLNLKLPLLQDAIEKFNNSAISISNNSMNTAVQQEMITILLEMNVETIKIYNSRLTDIAVVKNATLLQKKLQDCALDPTIVSASVNIIAGYINNLKTSNVDVTLLNEKLAILKEKSSGLVKSGIAVDIKKIEATVLSGFLLDIDDVQKEILKIQDDFRTNSSLVKYSEQIYSLLQGCAHRFVINANHMAAVQQYIQWLVSQGIDVTNLNTKLAKLNDQATKFNEAVAALNAESAPADNTGTIASTVPSNSDQTTQLNNTGVVSNTGITVSTVPSNSDQTTQLNNTGAVSNTGITASTVPSNSVQATQLNNTGAVSNTGITVSTVPSNSVQATQLNNTGAVSNTGITVSSSPSDNRR